MFKKMWFWILDNPEKFLIRFTIAATVIAVAAWGGVIYIALLA